MFLWIHSSTRAVRLSQLRSRGVTAPRIGPRTYSGILEE